MSCHVEQHSLEHVNFYIASIFHLQQITTIHTADGPLSAASYFLPLLWSFVHVS